MGEHNVHGIGFVRLPVLNSEWTNAPYNSFMYNVQYALLTNPLNKWHLKKKSYSRSGVFTRIWHQQGCWTKQCRLPNPSWLAETHIPKHMEVTQRHLVCLEVIIIIIYSFSKHYITNLVTNNIFLKITISPHQHHQSSSEASPASQDSVGLPWGTRPRVGSWPESRAAASSSSPRPPGRR